MRKRSVNPGSRLLVCFLCIMLISVVFACSKKDDEVKPEVQDNAQTTEEKAKPVESDKKQEEGQLKSQEKAEPVNIDKVENEEPDKDSEQQGTDELQNSLSDAGSDAETVKPMGENHQLAILTGIKSKSTSVYDKKYETDVPGEYLFPVDVENPDNIFISIIESCIIPDEETAALFPEFAEVMQQSVDSIDERVEASFDYLKQTAYEIMDFNEGLVGAMSLSDQSRMTTFRADYNAVSFIRDSYMNFGGAHGMYGYDGIQYDTATGRELSFKDVVKDTEKFEKLCAEQLSVSYPQSFIYFEDEGFDSREEYILNLIHPFFGGGSPSWLLGYEGVTAFWLPYDIGSYAEGEFTCTIFFKDHPELFEEKYMDVPEDYMISSRHDNNAVFGIAGKQEFAIEGVPIDYQYQLMYRDEVYPTEGLKEFPDEIYCSSFEYRIAYVKGSYYLLLNTFFESDDSFIMVFRMNEAGTLEFVQLLDEAGFLYDHFIDDDDIWGTSKVYDPSKIEIHTRNDRLGTTFGTNTYSMNEKGELVALSPIYGNSGEERVYTLLKDVTFGLVPADIVGKSEFAKLDGEVTINAGAHLRLRGFYGDNGLIFSDENDEADTWYYVETAREGWQVYVDGEPVDDVFEGILYAD